MSGALAQHRPSNIPLVIGGVPVLKTDNRGEYVWKHVLKPGGTYVNGRCTDYQVLTYVATRHVLTPVIEPNRPSKHAAGRTRPRTGKEQAKVARATRRITQLRKSMTVDAAKLGAVYDEM